MRNAHILKLVALREERTKTWGGGGSNFSPILIKLVVPWLKWLKNTCTQIHTHV